MKIAITDACIFIDLCNFELIHFFFQLEYEIHTSYDLFDELEEYQKNILHPYKEQKKLFVHSINEDERFQIHDLGLPKGLTINDKTAIYLALKLKAFILSSDGLPKNTAKERSILCHGFVWVMDRLIDSNILDKATAVNLLKHLLNNDNYYKNNGQLRRECESRIKKWENE